MLVFWLTLKYKVCIIRHIEIAIRMGLSRAVINIFRGE